MDPYLEAHWLDLHNSMVHLTKASLQPQLGDALVARSEERIIVEDPIGVPRLIGPDVRIVEHGPPGEGAQPARVAVAEPLMFVMESEPITQRYLEIIDVTTDGRVITVIEFVSPTNKLPGDGRRKYQEKQEECRDARVNLVEIDLTRSGERELLVHRWSGARQHESTYQVSLWRATSPSRCWLYPIRLQDRLPAIRIPLRPTDPDAIVELQELIDTAYEASRYDRTTDYRRPCGPPLDGEEAAWSDELLKAAGKR